MGHRIEVMTYPSHDDVIYLAGIIDGEGSISIARSHSNRGYSPSYRVRLLVSNTYMPLLEWIQSLWGGHIWPWGGARPGEASGLWKPGFCWEIDSRPAGRIIERIRPYLRVKAAQAWLALEYLAHYLPGHGPNRLSAEELALREGFHLASLYLNRRGGRN